MSTDPVTSDTSDEGMFCLPCQKFVTHKARVIVPRKGTCERCRDSVSVWELWGVSPYPRFCASERPTPSLAMRAASLRGVTLSGYTIPQAKDPKHKASK